MTTEVKAGRAMRQYQYSRPDPYDDLHFTNKQVHEFHNTAHDLASRLHRAVENLANELYEDMDLPRKAFDLKFDEGL